MTPEFCSESNALFTEGEENVLYLHEQSPKSKILCPLIKTSHPIKTKLPQLHPIHLFRATSQKTSYGTFFPYRKTKQNKQKKKKPQ